MKAHQAATRPSAGGDVLSSAGVVACVTGLEVGLGLMLVTGAYPRTTRRVTLACFTVFAGVASYKTFAGDSSCGCFGQIQVAPWLTLAFDLTAVGALAMCGLGNPTRPAAPNHRSLAAVAVALAAAAAGAVLALTPEAVPVTPDGDFVGAGRVVVLQPKDWIGKPFPLRKYVEIDEDLSRGRWTLILFQRDCPKCQSVLNRHQVGAPARGDRLVLIEVPPPGEPGSSDAPIPGCVYGRLAGTKEWFVELPVCLELIDGKVGSVQTREDAGPTAGARRDAEADRRRVGRIGLPAALRSKRPVAGSSPTDSAGA
jgi:hypothetical protein